MTGPQASLTKLKQVRAWEYAVRFVFGGAVTAMAGWIGARYGAAVGGMFLAFPAILPASLTLVQQHSGRREAIDDARGGRVGTLALASFALIVTVSVARWPLALSLVLALATWTAVAIAAWQVLLSRR